MNILDYHKKKATVKSKLDNTPVMEKTFADNDIQLNLKIIVELARERGLPRF